MGWEDLCGHWTFGLDMDAVDWWLLVNDDSIYLVVISILHGRADIYLLCTFPKPVPVCFFSPSYTYTPHPPKIFL
jgi:hypothetical protein